MRIKCAIIIGCILAMDVASVQAADFKKPTDCVVGAKVMDRQDRVGTITSASEGMCRVTLDKTGEKTSYLFWMLRPAGASKVTDDKLVKGVYECSGSGHYLFMDLIIDGPDAYHDNAGNKGRYHWDQATGKIVFKSGPFEKANAQLLTGPSIGLNMDGGSFFGTTCDLNKMK